MLYWLSRNVSSMIEQEIPDIRKLTILFFTLVFFAATQGEPSETKTNPEYELISFLPTIDKDIAVDGWALTLLSQDNLSYASTAQTIGLNSGYFLSFTVFLAFNSVEFSNKYFRPQKTPSDIPLVTLAGYLKFAAAAYLCVTCYLAFIHTEDSDESEEENAEMGIKKVYSIMYSICKLKHVQSFLFLHLVAKLGTATNDAATSLKLLEKGLSKEDLALAVLIDFPFQLIFGYLAAKWSKGDKPLKPVNFHFLFCFTPNLLTQIVVVDDCNVVATRLCSCSYGSY